MGDRPTAERPDIHLQSHPELRRGGKLFWRNSWTSLIAFAIDLVLLWVLVQFAGMARLPAAAIGFMVGISTHYLLSRKFVFPHSERGLGRGYVYFLLNALVGLLVTIGVFWGLMQLLPGWHYLIARGIASVAAGILVFVLNAVFNFKSLGTHAGGRAANRAGDQMAQP